MGGREAGLAPVRGGGFWMVEIVKTPRPYPPTRTRTRTRMRTGPGTNVQKPLAHLAEAMTVTSFLLCCRCLMRCREQPRRSRVARTSPSIP